MKKYVILALATAILFGLTATAQNQTPPQGRNEGSKEMRKGDKPQLSPEKRADRMTKELGLSDVEKTQVQALLEKRDAKRKQNIGELSKIKEEKRIQFEADRKIQDAELEKIIGKEKFQKFQTKREEFQAKRSEGNQRSGKRERGQFNPEEKPQVSAQNRAAKMAKELNLSDLEKAKVQTLIENQDASRKLKQAEVKKFKDEQMTKFENERKGQDADLEKIIGTEKFQKFQSMRTEHKDQMNERKGRMMKERPEGNERQRMGREMQKRDFKQADRPQITAKERAEKMAKQVGLSDAETAKIQALFEKQDAKRELQKAEIKKIRDEQKIKFENERKVQDADIETIIGKEKFQKIVALRAEHLDKMNKMRDHNSNDSTFHKVKDRHESKKMNEVK